MDKFEEPPRVSHEELAELYAKHHRQHELEQQTKQEVADIDKMLEEAKPIETINWKHKNSGGRISRLALLAGLGGLFASQIHNGQIPEPPYRKRTGKPHDGRVKKSDLIREDFPSRQAWRAHQREQDKAHRQGVLY